MPLQLSFAGGFRIFLRDTPGESPPCLEERASDDTGYFRVISEKFLLLLALRFLFFAQRRPYRPHHGEEAGSSADEVGDGLRQEYAVDSQSAHMGQQKGQGNHDDHFPEQ